MTLPWPYLLGVGVVCGLVAVWLTRRLPGSWALMAGLGVLYAGLLWEPAGLTGVSAFSVPLLVGIAFARARANRMTKQREQQVDGLQAGFPQRRIAWLTYRSGVPAWCEGIALELRVTPVALLLVPFDPAFPPYALPATSVDFWASVPIAPGATLEAPVERLGIRVSVGPSQINVLVDVTSRRPSANDIRSLLVAWQQAARDSGNRSS